MGLYVTAFERAARRPDPAAQQVLTRVALERLVDELDELERLTGGDDELDRDELRERVSDATRLAVALRRGRT
jgi:hypothetical protein